MYTLEGTFCVQCIYLKRLLGGWSAVARDKEDNNNNNSPSGVASFFCFVGILSRGSGWKKAAKGRRG